MTKHQTSDQDWVRNNLPLIACMIHSRTHTGPVELKKWPDLAVRRERLLEPPGQKDGGFRSISQIIHRLLGFNDDMNRMSEVAKPRPM